MQCLGDTIARALALVSIGTIAAFVHWAATPLRLTLVAPNDDQAVSAPDAPPATTGGSVTAATPDVHTDPVSDGVSGDAQGAASAGDSVQNPVAPFDANTLGTEIGTPAAHQLWLSGAVAFIDARPQRDYVAGHIPYSYLVPAETIADGRLGDMMELGGVDPSMRVVVYCEGGTCDASHLVALTLQDMGFTKIHIDVDGYPGWQNAGHEIETGSDMVLGDVP